MRHSNRRGAVALLLVAVLSPGLAACGRAMAEQDEVTDDPPAMVEPVEGTALSRVTLSQRAAERLGIQTAQVGVARVPVVKGGGTRKVLPYPALLYDENGDTWTFTSPQHLVFLRRAVKVDYIEGDRAFLLDGPPAGTTVVTVGAAELFGAERGIGEG